MAVDQAGDSGRRNLYRIDLLHGGVAVFHAGKDSRKMHALQLLGPTRRQLSVQILTSSAKGLLQPFRLFSQTCAVCSPNAR